MEQWLEQEERTYNSAQLAVKLNTERQVQLSARRLRHLLQKRAFAGNGPVTRIKANKTLSKNGSNKLTLIP